MRRTIRNAIIVFAAVTATAALLAQCATGGATNNNNSGGDSGSCASPNMTCGSSCIDPTNDDDNCGGCGTVCPSGQVCSASKCASGCASGTSLCMPDGGKSFCASTQTDQKNCGSCGNVCPNGGACSGGKCSASVDSGMTCGMGLSSCAGADGGVTCVNEQTDDNHCGSCTTTCLAMIETCTMGSCASACTGGKTLCIPDGGAGDGGPIAHCADLQNDNTDCGACFSPCSGGATCTMGKCKSTLLGSGTAADPWHTATALANCGAYLTSFPSATDGVYTTHPKSADIGVYCDMTHGGVTYEDFGFGQWSATYTGYAICAATDFSGTSQFAAAFAYLYTRNVGLTNLNPGGWTDSNCCIENSGGTTDLGLGGSSYMYPAVGGTADCTTSYSASYIELTLEPSGTVLTSITSSQASSATSSSTCSTSGNPAIFVKKY